MIRGRKELLPSGRNYTAFCDMSGGRSDSAALAIAHQVGRNCVLDLLRVYRPPFSPAAVCRLMADELKRYGIRRITGDNYAAEYTDAAFAECGIGYMKAQKPVSALYAELLPRLTGGEIELLDDDLLVNQLATLERRVRAGGKDQISHPPGGHDDAANAVAGVACAAPARRVGALFN